MGLKAQDLLVDVFMVEISNHRLCPKQLTRLLPSRSQCTSLSVFKVAQQTHSIKFPAFSLS